MERITAYKGQKFTIAFAQERSGHSPGAEFFDRLPLGEKAKLVNLFRLFADNGHISNDEKFGVLDTGLFEFKCYQIRRPFATLQNAALSSSHTASRGNRTERRRGK